MVDLGLETESVNESYLNACEAGMEEFIRATQSFVSKTVRQNEASLARKNQRHPTANVVHSMGSLIPGKKDFDGYQHDADNVLAGGNLEDIKQLAQRGLLSEAKFRAKALKTAASYGHADIVRYLCPKDGNILLSDEHIEGAILSAAKAEIRSQDDGLPEVVSWLLSVRANVPSTATSNEAIRLATRHGGPTVLQLLLQYTRPNALVVEDALEKAVQFRQTCCAQLLVSYASR